MSRLRWLVFIGLLIAGGGGAAMLMRDKKDQPAPPVGRPVAAPQSLAGPTGIGALGRVEPASRVRRLNQPGGMAVTRIARLLVEEGDKVSAGTLLAEFADAAQKDATAAAARASVAEAKAQLAKVEAAGRPSEIAAQKERIRSLAAQQEIASRDADRSERLRRSGAGAEAQSERDRFAALRAAADRAQAEADLTTLSQARPEDIALARARLANSEAALTKALADAELSRIYAPIAGTVLKIFVRPGDQVGEDGVMELGDLDQLEIVADIYETDLPRLRLGAAAEIIVPGESKRYAATVKTLGWTVRRQTQANSDPIAALDARTVEVRLALAADALPVLQRRINMQVQIAIRP